jgi:uncharacterized protein (UPF0333 family)
MTSLLAQVYKDAKQISKDLEKVLGIWWIVIILFWFIVVLYYAIKNGNSKRKVVKTTPGKRKNK